MNTTEFKKQFKCAQNTLNREYMHSVIEETIDALSTDSNPRGHENLIIVMEELSELSQQVSKTLRGQEDRMHLLEELADVYIGNEFVKSICGFSDDEIARAINVKLDRLHTRSSNMLLSMSGQDKSHTLTSHHKAIRFLTLDDLDSVFELIQTVGKEKEKDDTFAYSKDKEIYRKILEDGFSAGVFIEDKLVASLLVYTGNDDPEHVYREAGIISQEDLVLSVIFESCQVLPAYRGNHYQKALMEFAIANLSEFYSRVLATVHPHNAPSVRSLKSVGFVFCKRARLYNDKPRDIMMLQI